MSYSSEVESLYIEHGGWPPAFARLWQVIRTVSELLPTRRRTVYEDLAVFGGGQRTHVEHDGTAHASITASAAALTSRRP